MAMVISTLIDKIISDLKTMDFDVSYKRLIHNDTENKTKLYTEYFRDKESSNVYIYLRTKDSIEGMNIICGYNPSYLQPRDFIDGIKRWNAEHEDFTLYLDEMWGMVVIKPSFLKGILSDMLEHDFDGNTLSAGRIVSMDENTNIGFLVGMQNSGFGYIINYIGKENPIQQVNIKNIMFSGKIPYDELNNDSFDRVDTISKLNFEKNDMSITDSDGKIIRLVFKEE